MIGDPFVVSTANETSGALLSLAANGSDNVTVTLPTDRCIEIYAITGVSTGAFSLRLRDASDQHGWSDRLIPDVCIVGTGEQPYPLPGRGTYVFRRNGFVSFDFLDTSGSTNPVAVYLWGTSRDPCLHDEITEGGTRRQGHPHWLGVQEQIQADSVDNEFIFGPPGEPMLIDHLLADDTAGFAAWLKTDATQQGITQSPIEAEGLWGTNVFQRKLPSPLKLGGNTRLVASVRDTASAIQTIFLVAGGWKGAD